MQAEPWQNAGIVERMETKMVKIDLRVPETAKLELMRLASADGRSLNAYLNRVLAQHVREAAK